MVPWIMFVANDTGYFYWQTVQNATRRESHHESAKEFENLWPEGEFLMLCFNGTPCRDWVLPCDKAGWIIFFCRQEAWDKGRVSSRSVMPGKICRVSQLFLPLPDFCISKWPLICRIPQAYTNKITNMFESTCMLFLPFDRRGNNIALPLKQPPVMVWVRPLLGLALFILADLRRSPL